MEVSQHGKLEINKLGISSLARTQMICLSQQDARSIQCLRIIEVWALSFLDLLAEKYLNHQQAK